MKLATTSWFEKRPGAVVGMIMAALLTYMSASMAIDSGSMLYYLVTFIWLYIAIKQLIRSFKPTHEPR